MAPRTVYLMTIAAVILAALALRLWDPTPVARLRLQVFDAFQQAKPRPYQAELPVRIIDIDDESLRRFGQWPWPRTMLAKMVQTLNQLGAAAVGFDIVFPEPDRLSPDRILSQLPEAAAVEHLLKETGETPSNDAKLAEALTGARVVLGFIASPAGTGAPPESKSGFAHAGDDPKLFVPHFPAATVSLPELQKNASGAAALNWVPEYDQIVRRLPLLVSVDDKIFPSLGPETLRLAQGASTYVVKSSGASGEESFGQKTGVNHVRVGEFTVPTAADGSMWMWFTPTEPERFVPAWKVLEGKLTPEEAQGVIFLVGTSAAGLFDLRTTPLDSSVPGVELHAQAIEQILQGHFLQRPDFATAAEMAFILVLGLLIAWLIYRLGAIGGAVLAVVAIGGVATASWLAFDRLGWLVDPVYPAASLATVYVAGTVIVFLRTEAERNRVRSAFSHYMAPALLAKLAADPSQLKLGGEMREMTLLFSDVRGFTGIAEGMSAEELTRFINSLFTPLSNVIMEQGGTIDKYMGDAVMAFWNAPLDDPDHARHGCRAALGMMACMEGLNKTWRAEWEAQGRPFKPVEIGVGLNTGESCVGNMGSEKRFDYSVIGDNVNVASRLEGQTKTYDVGIVVGESTKLLAPEFAYLELDILKVKGRSLPVRAYALLGDEQMTTLNTFQALVPLHEAMLAHFRAREWDAAEAALHQCEAAQGFGLETLYEIYRSRINTFRREPPPDGWDGSYEALHK